MHDLTETAVSYRHILRMTLPLLIANLSVPLLGIVDTAILGHLDNALYLAAAALGAQVITGVFWIFGFLRMGTTGFTARALGEKNDAALNRALQQSLVFALVISVFILITGWFSLPLIIDLVSGSSQPEIRQGFAQLALEYSYIRIYSAPATLCTYVLVGWLIGMQRTSYAMYILLVTNLTNILLDYIFIIDMQMNTRGAALASLIAEYLGFTLAIGLTLTEVKKCLGYKRVSKLLNISAYKEMLISSEHLFVRTLLLLFVFIFFTSQGARFGDTTLAANAILLSLLSLTAYFLDGFAYSAETLCGQAWGEKNTRLLKDVCLKTTLLALAVAGLFSLGFLFFSPFIISAYTDLEMVYKQAKEHVVWLIFLPLIAIWSYQLDGIFIGIGRTKAMRNNMFISVIFIFLPCWYASKNLGNTGLWISFLCFFAARGLTMAKSGYDVYLEVETDK